VDYDGLPPAEAILRMATSYRVAQIVRAMVVLNLADHLAAGPRTAADLAKATETHPPSLARLLRALVALGLCAYDATGQVRLTPLGETLRSEAPHSARPHALLHASSWFQRPWEELAQAIRTGAPTFRGVHGVEFWEYLAAHPDDGAVFDAAMTAGAAGRAAALLAARDLSSVGTVVDVGGGRGRLLAELLAAVPGLRGILADRPEVVAGAAEVLRAAGVEERCAVVGADFFTSVPPGGDAYVLAQIIHDWPEQEALAILRACHRAMTPGARLWVIERAIPSGADIAPALALIDLHMLTMHGGQERTAEEYRQLLESAGFAEITAHPTDTMWGVVEGVRR
jgi:ubiquinone/menaquinone biosynthesis C-methylase UbiE